MTHFNHMKTMKRNDSSTLNMNVVGPGIDAGTRDVSQKNQAEDCCSFFPFQVAKYRRLLQ